MLYVDPNTTFKTGEGYARLLLHLDGVYKGLRKIRAVFVFTFLVVPILWVLKLWLRKKRKQFMKQMASVSPDVTNKGQYLSLKKAIDKFDNIKQPLTVLVKFEDLKSVPFTLRPLFKEMQKLGSCVLDYREWLQNHFCAFNNSKFSSELEIFKFVSEKDLWHDRNKVYKYWL